MKKTLFILMPIAITVVIFIIFSSLNISVVRDVKNGLKKSDGSLTYNLVYVEDTFFNDYIYARDEGFEDCPKTLSVSDVFSNQDDVDAAMHYAFEKINQGKFEGKVNLETGLTVKWKSEDKEGINSIIKVFSTGSEEPKTRTDYSNSES